MRRLRFAAFLLLASSGASAAVAPSFALDFDRGSPSPSGLVEAIRARAAATPVAASQSRPAPVPLVVFPSDSKDIAAWMNAEGWQSRRDDPGAWELGGGVIHMLSHADSVLIGTERGFPRDIGPTPILRLRLKVRVLPRGTDLARRSADDSALRVFIAFDRGGGFLLPPRTLGYAWSEKDDAGTLIASAFFSNVRYISVGKGITPADEWVVVERDLAADYRLAFPGDADVPALKGIALKCDSNDTKTSAESWLSAVELRAR